MEDSHIIDLYWQRDPAAITETGAKYGLPVLAKMPIDPELARQADHGMIETFAGEYLDGAAKAVAALRK